MSVRHVKGDIVAKKFILNTTEYIFSYEFTGIVIGSTAIITEDVIYGRVADSTTISAERDDAQDQTTITDIPKPDDGTRRVIIWGTQKHVNLAPVSYGAAPYRCWKEPIIDTVSYNLAMERNRRWIRDMIREGSQILDIGYDTTRGPDKYSGLIRSPFYAMEKMEIEKSGCYSIPVWWNGHTHIYPGVP